MASQSDGWCAPVPPDTEQTTKCRKKQSPTTNTVHIQVDTSQSGWSGMVRSFHRAACQIFFYCLRLVTSFYRFYLVNGDPRLNSHSTDRFSLQHALQHALQLVQWFIHRVSIRWFYMVFHFHDCSWRCKLLSTFVAQIQHCRPTCNVHERHSCKSSGTMQWLLRPRPLLR